MAARKHGSTTKAESIARAGQGDRQAEVEIRRLIRDSDRYHASKPRGPAVNPGPTLTWDNKVIRNDRGR